MEQTANEMTPDETVSEPAPEKPSEANPPLATWHANGSDLTALAALSSGLLMVFTCLTCNLGFYCLPVLPVLLGVIGVAIASRAVNPRQSKLWSWIGLGSGAVVILLIIAGVVLYFAFLLVIILTQGDYSTTLSA